MGDAGAGPDGGGCTSYVARADLSVPVSFANQVMPIFQQSCAPGGPSCHGDPGSGPIQAYLGSVDGGVDPSTILARIVDVVAAEDPGMKLVAPGDPARSFLLHKMDGDQCMFAAACATTGYDRSYPMCGSTMPLNADSLPSGARDTVRAWIAQGAK
jgi:hypothetical protein